MSVATLLGRLRMYLSSLAKGRPKAAESLPVSAIKVIYDLLGVDAGRVQWMGDTSASTLLAEGYGFDWWPGDFKVKIRINGPHPELDYPLYRLNAQTDFLCDVDVTGAKFEKNISDLNRKAQTYALITHPKTVLQSLGYSGSSSSELGLDLKSTRVWLGSTAYVHEGTMPWAARLFAGLAVLQPIEAQLRADVAALLLGGKVDRSTPPGGTRPKGEDDILGVDQDLAFHGQEPSKWIGTGEFERIIKRWGECDSGFGDAGKDWLGLEMPYGDDTAMLKFHTDRPHPRLGHGLLAVLTLPYRERAESIISALSIELNFMEITRWIKMGAPLIGGWSAEDWGRFGEPNFMPALTCFIPNMMYRAGLAENLVMDAMVRAKWFREKFQPDAIDLPMYKILDRRLGKSK